MYLSTGVSLVAFFGVLVSLVGGAFLDKILHWGWDLSVYILNQFPGFCVLLP